MLACQPPSSIDRSRAHQWSSLPAAPQNATLGHRGPHGGALGPGSRVRPQDDAPDHRHSQPLPHPIVVTINALVLVLVVLIVIVVTSVSVVVVVVVVLIVLVVLVVLVVILLLLIHVALCRRLRPLLSVLLLLAILPHPVLLPLIWLFCPTHLSRRRPSH